MITTEEALDRMYEKEMELERAEYKIAELEGTLEFRHAERVREIDSHMERVSGLEAEIGTVKSKLAEAETTIGGLKHFIGEQTDEIGRLRKALLWSVREGARFDGHGAIEYDWGWNDRRVINCDGTDESLIETLCRLAQEGE